MIDNYYPGVNVKTINVDLTCPECEHEHHNVDIECEPYDYTDHTCEACGHETTHSYAKLWGLE